MEKALRRSRRRNNLEVRGTFNRDIAVKREDLVKITTKDHDPNDPNAGAVV